MKIHNLFKGPRKPETAITKKDMDIAASIQSVTNEIVLKFANILLNNTSVKIYAWQGE